MTRLAHEPGFSFRSRSRFRFAAAAGAVALTAAGVVSFPSAAMASFPSIGTDDRQDGIRAFLDENGNGVYDPGERLVPGITLTASFCFWPKDGGSVPAFGCDDRSTVGSPSDGLVAVTGDDGRIHLQGDDSDTSTEMEINGSDYPYLDHVTLTLPAGVTSPLAVDGVVTLEGLRGPDGELPPERPATQTGYFIDGGWVADPNRANRASRAWQLLDVPLTMANPVAELADATPATPEAVARVLGRQANRVKFGAMAFEDANGDGVLSPGERLVPGVGMELEICQQPADADSLSCAPPEGSLEGYATSTQGTLVDRTTHDTIDVSSYFPREDGTGATPLRAWISRARVTGLPAGWQLSPRPAGWQESRVDSQFDPASDAVDYADLGPARAGEAHPIDGSRSSYVIGYFNGSRFVADPQARDDRSRLWNLAIVGLRPAPFVDAPATVSAMPTSDVASKLSPAVRVWADANGDGAWNPDDEPLIAGLPVSISACQTWWGNPPLCEPSGDYKTVTASDGYVYGNQGDSPGDWWTRDVPHPDATPGPLINPFGDTQLEFVPAGFSIIATAAPGVPFARASHADTAGLVAALPDDESWRQLESGRFVDGRFVPDPDLSAPGVRLYRFANIGLRANPLEVSVQPCATDAEGYCARPGHAVITVRNATGTTHRDVRPSLSITVDGVELDLGAACPAIAQLADGETATCELDYDPGVAAIAGQATARVASQALLGARGVATSSASAQQAVMFRAVPPTATPGPSGSAPADPTAPVPPAPDPTAGATTDLGAVHADTSADGGDLATSGEDAGPGLALLAVAVLGIAAGALLARRRAAAAADPLE